MQPEYELITREITAKGKGYLLLRRCPPEQLEETIRRAADTLLRHGATELLAASLDPAAPLTEGEGRGYRLALAHEMVRMSRSLAGRPSGGELTLEPLRRAQGGAWLALHNEIFFDVPNSATYDGRDLELALDGGRRCGFALRAGTPVGIYELNLEGETPEIEGLGLTRAQRGQGLGRALLLAGMDALAALGYGACCLKVSTANQAAWGLYRSVGFAQDAVISRWYRVLAQGDLRAE